jgi:hypothetical protein
MGIPYGIANNMAIELDASFIKKRPKIAFPKNIHGSLD